MLPPQSVYSLLGSRSKSHTLLFCYVFISALDFVLNKLCSLLCPFFVITLHICTTGRWFIYEALDVSGTLGMYVFVFLISARSPIGVEISDGYIGCGH